MSAKYKLMCAKCGHTYPIEKPEHPMQAVKCPKCGHGGAYHIPTHDLDPALVAADALADAVEAVESCTDWLDYEEFRTLHNALAAYRAARKGE